VKQDHGAFVTKLLLTFDLLIVSESSLLSHLVFFPFFQPGGPLKVTVDEYTVIMYCEQWPHTAHHRHSPLTTATSR
jgi:hypothetical protein